MAGGVGLETIWTAGCRAARRRSRPFCSTSGTWPASATSTPTRSCGGRQLSPLRAAGSLSADEVGRAGRGDPHAAGRRRAAARAARSPTSSTPKGEQGSFQDWLQAYGKQGQECSAVRRHLRARGRGGEGHRLLSRLPALREPAAAGRGASQGTKKRAPSELAFHLSTALTSFPLRCTSRPFTSAFPLRVPL